MTYVDTSAEAFNSVKPKLKKQHEVIINAMQLKADKAMSSEQIADIVGVPVWRRMNELERAGAIIQTEELVVNRSGRRAHTYRLARAQ